MTETQWTSKICKGLKRFFDVVALVGSLRQRPGLPDRMLVGHGSVIFVEFKGPNTPIKKHQEILLRQWSTERRVLAFLARQDDADYLRGALCEYKDRSLSVCRRFEDGEDLASYLISRI